MVGIELQTLLSNGVFCVVDSSSTNRLSLVTQLKLLESRVQTEEYSNIAECLERWKSRAGAADVRCVFLSIEEGPQRCSEFIAACAELNKNVFFIATGSEIGTEDLRALISSGVSQVLLRPFDDRMLSQKMVLADQFQKQILKEAQFIPAINEFSTQIEQISGQVYVIHLHGWITANSALPDIVPELPKAKLFMDCEGLSGLNSIGVRKWLFWIKDLEKNGFAAFEFENVRPRVLNHVNTLAGFRPPTGQINSFYLVYDSDRVELEKEFKFRRDQDFDNETMALPALIEIMHDGHLTPLALDPLYKSQLLFYKGKINMVARTRKKLD